MTCREQEEDLAPDEASGVLCRCGHLLTDSDLHFCGYCGSVIQVTRGRRQAPAAVVSGRRAALAALASARHAAPAEPVAAEPVPVEPVLAEPVTDRFVAPPVRVLRPLPPPPAAPVPPVATRPAQPADLTEPPAPAPAASVPMVAAPATSAALAAAALAESAEAALAAAPAAPVASGAPATRAAKAAKARTTRANRPARVARAAGVATTPSATDAAPAPASPAPAAPAPPPTPAAAPAPTAPTGSTVDTPPPSAAPSGASATAPPPSAPPTEAPDPGPAPVEAGTSPSTAAEDAGGEPESAAAAAPETSVLGRRNWTGLLVLLVILGACAVRTGLGLLFTYPGYLSWLPVVLVAAVALLKVARLSIGLVAVSTAAVAAWWAVDHVVSTARLQALGYDIGQATIAVPGLVAAIGSVPLAAVLCALVDGHVRATVRAWVVPRGGPSSVRAAAVVLAVLAAVFPVAGSLSTQPGFAALTAARDQVRYPGYPTPGEIADRMHAMSVSKGRPVSMTCTYAPDDGAARPTYQCVGISQVGSEAAQVHDGIRSTALPDGTYSCVDLTSGVDRRLC